ncbi:MAG: alpha-galactosidase [Clostridiales bacterium]|jgi:alpha-galactosidase|nr:alpha-galactosidase [Clostridiales bacterium]
MDNFSLSIEYELNGVKYSQTALNTEHYDIEYSIKADRLQMFLTTKLPCSLKKFALLYTIDRLQDELFYSNGYSAWTTSREYGIGDKQTGVTPIAEIHPKLKALAAVSGDYLFVDYPKKKGLFHSFTYCYFRHGSEVRLLGSLSEREGFTIFKRDMNVGSFVIEKDVEGLTLDGKYKVFDIAIISGEYDDVFDKYFSAYGIKDLKIKAMSGYTSWYNYFQKIDEDIILRDLEGLTKVKDKANIFQIDDGYETFVGDWLDPNPSKFPNGMAYAAQKIHDAGFLAGLWLAPFNAQRASKLAAQHPDWLIKDNKTGKPLLGVVAWKGAYSLDIYNEDVRKYIKNVFDVVTGEWKFDMLKLDFLYSQCMQPRNNKTRGTIMCEAMEFLRECAKDKLILGCGVPLGAAFGYVDACRTGCDADLTYKGRYYNTLGVNAEIISTQNSINNTIFRRHLNGRAFCGDPDVFFLRNDNIKFTEEQKLLLARINNLFGGVLFVSDDINKYDPRQTEALKNAFTKRASKIISAEYISQQDIKITFAEDGTEKELYFNLKTGEIYTGSALGF